MTAEAGLSVRVRWRRHGGFPEASEEAEQQQSVGKARRKPAFRRRNGRSKSPGPRRAGRVRALGRQTFRQEAVGGAGSDQRRGSRRPGGASRGSEKLGRHPVLPGAVEKGGDVMQVKYFRTRRLENLKHQDLDRNVFSACHN